MILVVGGAGYIGSHTVKQLLDKGYEVIVLDNLSTGHKGSLDPRAIFIKGNLGDQILLRDIFETYSVEAVMHFAANSLVGESVENPLKYYKNNVAATLNLLESMIDHKINNFIFSSTAATYGAVDVDIINEETPTNPINPYGRSKLMVEEVLADLHHANGLNYVVLRYFNAAGAHSSGTIGEDHQPETHLIPLVLEHLQGERDSISVFGTDYATEDGTCIRDYIHVIDLADAHILALKSLINGENKANLYNLGSGNGYSVNEIIEGCQKVAETVANVKYVDRRQGDPAVLVASSEKIERELGWKPVFSLDKIISTAWEWHRNHPKGYRLK